MALLSGFDALHLASTLLVSSADAVVATWDHRLLVAAWATGLRTVPSTCEGAVLLCLEILR